LTNAALAACVTQMTNLTGSMEYEAVVVKLSSSEALRVRHELKRLNPLTYRGGNRRIGGRSHPCRKNDRRATSLFWWKQ